MEIRNKKGKAASGQWNIKTSTSISIKHKPLSWLKCSRHHESESLKTPPLTPKINKLIYKKENCTRVSLFLSPSKPGFAEMFPSSLCAPQHSLEKKKRNEKGNAVWMKGESVKRCRNKHKKGQKLSRVRTYLICPNFPALWLDKSLQRAGYVVNRCSKQASDSCSLHHRETG